MVVVVDGHSGSSAESSALMLKAAFGARIVGAPTYGSIDYGNICPYLLPRSGMQIQIPTRVNNWAHPVDFVGIQPDTRIDISCPTQSLAERFDDLAD